MKDKTKEICKLYTKSLKKGMDEVTIEMQQNRIKELERINEEHRKINGELREIINEAIEYIKSNLDNTNWLELGSQDVEVLLNILQGSDE